MAQNSPVSPPSPAETGPPLRKGQIVFFVTIVVVGCGLWYGTNEMLRRSAAARIPALGDLPGATSVELEQIRLADTQARRRPSSGTYVGILAKAYHANTHSAAARPCYELAAQLEPTQWRWGYYLVLLDEEIGDTDAALAGLRGVVKAAPGYAPAWFRLGEAAYSSGLDDEADQAYIRMRELADRPQPGAKREPFFPVEAYAAFGRARVALRQDRLEAVVDLLSPVTNRVPMFGAAHRLLGGVYQRLGREELAQQHLEQALRCGPYSPPVDPLIDDLTMRSSNANFLTREAGIAFNKGDVEWAERVLRRAAQLFPDDEGILGELTLLMVRVQRLGEALALLDRFLALPPTHHATPSKIGSELIRQQRLPEAIRCFQLAVQIQPAHPPNQLNLGMALASAGQVAEAENLFRETLRLDPYSHLARRNLSTALYDLKRYDEAIEAYASALELKADDADAHFRMGLALQITQRLDEAEVAFRDALEDAPAHARSMENLARLLAALGRPEEALELANRLVEVGGRFARAHFTLAYVARAAGDMALARLSCEAALRIDPNFAAARQLLDELEP